MGRIKGVKSSKAEEIRNVLSMILNFRKIFPKLIIAIKAFLVDKKVVSMNRPSRFSKP